MRTKVLLRGAELSAPNDRRHLTPAERDRLNKERKERVAFEKELGANVGPGNPTGANQHTEKEEIGNHDNIMNSSASSSQQGTSLGYAIRRLSRERPDLLEAVQAGEMSANAAMIQAGFRKKPSNLETCKSPSITSPSLP